MRPLLLLLVCLAGCGKNRPPSVSEAEWSQAADRVIRIDMSGARQFCPTCRQVLPEKPFPLDDYEQLQTLTREKDGLINRRDLSGRVLETYTPCDRRNPWRNCSSDWPRSIYIGIRWDPDTGGYKDVVLDEDDPRYGT